jgi:hypothetical protein
VFPANVVLCVECEAYRAHINRFRRYQRTYGGIGVLGSGQDDTGGGSQGSIGPKGVAVCLGVMRSFCSANPKHNMFIDIGIGDGRMLVYARQMFYYLRGTEIGGELTVLAQRTEGWMRCMEPVGTDTKHDLALYRHERDIDRPIGLSGVSIRVAVWHFHWGWDQAHIRRVQDWLVTFKVAVYVSVSPGFGDSVIEGFVHVFSATVKMTGQRGQSRARVFVRKDLVQRGA